jgi:hypothetical protein
MGAVCFIVFHDLRDSYLFSILIPLINGLNFYFKKKK